MKIGSAECVQSEVDKTGPWSAVEAELEEHLATATNVGETHMILSQAT